MKKRIAVIVIGAGLIAAMVPGLTFAADYSVPGTPGDKNCVGQTTAYLAQAGQDPSLDAPGIGNLARLAELSVKEVKAVIAAYCAAP